MNAKTMQIRMMQDRLTLLYRKPSHTSLDILEMVELQQGLKGLQALPDFTLACPNHPSVPLDEHEEKCAECAVTEAEYLFGA